MYRRAPRHAANSDFFAAAVRRALPGGTAYDELRRVFDFIHEGSGDARRRALCDDHIHRRLAAGAKMMVNGGEARRGDAGRKNVVEATHRKITRYAQTLGCKLAQYAERRHIIHADEGCGHALTPDQLRRFAAGMDGIARAVEIICEDSKAGSMLFNMSKGEK